jgi:hypothetical protein
MIFDGYRRGGATRGGALARLLDRLRPGRGRNALEAANAFRIDVWGGLRQYCGHLGCIQRDFNLTGHVYSPRPLQQLTCSLNDGEPRQIRFTPFRRIVEPGDFNADVPLAMLAPGENRAVISATDVMGKTVNQKVTIIRCFSHSYPLPANIQWSAVRAAEEVGVCTDGKWILTPEGIRTERIGYDRIFLIGDDTWTDYEVTTLVTVHAMAKRTGPQSGRLRHVGFCLRWSGHSIEDNASDEQPQWGLHPRGGIVWLTIAKGKLPPVRQFYSGDTEDFQNFDPFPILFGQPFWLKGSCETLEADSTRYSLKAWPFGSTEPATWDFQVVQNSATALRSGGVALVAHELDATFGDIRVTRPAKPRTSNVGSTDFASRALRL